MDSIRNRARALLPSVLLTLLSIVQAVALETLWDHSVHSSQIYEASLPAALDWLAITITLVIIILVWLMYVGLVMRFRWTPSVGDLSLPFFVGLSELLLIETIGLSQLGAWFMVLALINAMMGLVSHNLFRRARLDPDNVEFFSQIEPSTWRDHIPRWIYVAVLVMVGGWLWLSGEGGVLAGAALLAVLFATLYQLLSLVRYWRTSMGE